jgi:hypothetical protein
MGIQENSGGGAIRSSTLLRRGRHVRTCMSLQPFRPGVRDIAKLAELFPNQDSQVLSTAEFFSNQDASVDAEPDLKLSINLNGFEGMELLAVAQTCSRFDRIPAATDFGTSTPNVITPAPGVHLSNA